jgi:hypothetical protein
VVMTYVDTTARDEKAGIRKIEIVSSQSPKKRPDPATEEGRAQVQEMLDDLAAVFIEDVARFRAVSEETVLSDFGRGGVLVGARAVTAGLADGLGSFEGVLAELCERTQATAAGGGPYYPSSQETNMAVQDTKPAATSEPPTPPAITAESVAADHPAVAEALRLEGATRERERILGIEDLAIEGHETLIAECKADPACTVEAAAVRVVKAAKEKPAAPPAAGSDGGKKHLSVLAGAEADLDPPAPGGADGDPDSVQAQVARILTAGKPATARNAG